MERLTEKNPTWIDEEFWVSAEEPDIERIDDVYLKLREYEDAEEQGLLVRCNLEPLTVEQEILVTDGQSVWQDTFMTDGEECYLDSGDELVTEVTAWQPKPEPYRG